MAKVERVAYLKARLEDRPGALLKVLQDLKAKNLALKGLWGFATQGGQADLYVVPKNPEKVKSAWQSSGIFVEEGTGFFLKGVDRTGALLKRLESVANSGVNIDAIDAVAVGGRYGSFVWVKAADVDRAARALGAK